METYYFHIWESEFLKMLESLWSKQNKSMNSRNWNVGNCKFEKSKITHWKFGNLKTWEFDHMKFEHMKFGQFGHVHILKLEHLKLWKSESWILEISVCAFIKCCEAGHRGMMKIPVHISSTSWIWISYLSKTWNGNSVKPTIFSIFK